MRPTLRLHGPMAGLSLVAALASLVLLATVSFATAAAPIGTSRRRGSFHLGRTGGATGAAPSRRLPGAFTLSIFGFGIGLPDVRMPSSAIEVRLVTQRVIDPMYVCMYRMHARIDHRQTGIRDRHPDRRA